MAEELDDDIFPVINMADVVKGVFDNLYEDLFAECEQKLRLINGSYDQLDLPELLELLKELQEMELTLPLPSDVKEQNAGSRGPGIQDIVYTKSFETERRSILETIGAVQKRVLTQIIRIAPDLKNNLWASLQNDNLGKKTGEIVSDGLNISSMKSNRPKGIFEQIEDKRIYNYLVENYFGRKPRIIVPMLFAITDYGLLKTSTVFDNQSKLYLELQKFFGLEGPPQSLNSAYIRYNSPTSKHRNDIDYHKSMLIAFRESLQKNG